MPQSITMLTLLFLVVIGLANISYSKAWHQYDECDLRYEKVGCFVDKPGKDRALPEELLNERDLTSPNYDGHVIDWRNYGKSVHNLACRCAAKTKDMGYKVFGLQFYGECWSGPGGEEAFSKYGEADRKKCFQNIYNPNDIHCNKGKEQPCIGGKRTNYVYRIKELRQSSPVNGGYTSWSDWTPCTKTCGGGVSTRSRTCTNPKPENGGKDCSQLGEPEELKACGEHACPVACKRALDIGIILDGSTSVYKRNFKKAKEFLKNLTHYFTVSPQGTHFGVIVFSTNATMEFTLADSRYHDPKALVARIDAIRYPRGWTRTDKALLMASNELFTPAGGDRPDKPNVLIVFTDGGTNKGSKRYSEVLPPLEAKGVETIAVGIGNRIKDSELLAIAMNKPENVKRIDNFDVLQEKLGVLLQNVCKGKTAN